MLLRVKIEDISAEDHEVAILHDRRETMTIRGSEAANWRDLFDKCIESPKPN
jgi:hypothetical protein